MDPRLSTWHFQAKSQRLGKKNEINKKNKIKQFFPKKYSLLTILSNGFSYFPEIPQSLQQWILKMLLCLLNPEK